MSVFVAEALLIFALLANLVWRHRLERSLVESEARFRNMADTAPVHIWVTGPDSQCTFVNKPWLTFTGRTLEQELNALLKSKLTPALPVDEKPKADPRLNPPKPPGAENG